jgi:L,D-transpeptidase YcbB
MSRREAYKFVSPSLSALIFVLASALITLPALAQEVGSTTSQGALTQTTPVGMLDPGDATSNSGPTTGNQAEPTTPVAAPAKNPTSSAGSARPEPPAATVKNENGTPAAQPAAAPSNEAIPNAPEANPSGAAMQPDDFPLQTPPGFEPASAKPESSANPAGSPNPVPAAASSGSIPPSPAPAAASPSPKEPAPVPVLAAPATNPAPAPTTADLIKSALDALTSADGKDKMELREEHAAIASYYAARDYAPLWLDNGKPSDTVAPVMAQLAHAADDGLDFSGLAAPVFAVGPDKLAAADVALSAEVVAYGRQASGCRVDPQMISGLIGAKPDLPDPQLILAAVAAAGADGGAMLQGFNPQQKAYLALREKLIELRRGAKPNQTIPIGRSLRVGMSDPRVPLIRARLGLEPDPAHALLYDGRLAAAVADFQRDNGLWASGVLTARTLEALDEPSRLENEIIANMEVWRWMPRELGSSRIDVNIPDFMADVVEDGEVVERHKVIVGKPDTPTPVFSNSIKFLIVNPVWNVPPSIIRKEMLPHLAADPNYLSEMGYEAFMQNGRLVVRQPPGERNALGLIKFMFPNQYSVYLHDTPTRSLFAAARRAFSHGCVRVDQPFALAQTLLGPRWPEARLKGLVGGPEHYVYLPKPLPIHIEYFTAYVDDAGHLQVRNDLYGYSRKVEVALGLQSDDIGPSARD